MIGFNATRSGTGTAEWAEINFNITKGCPNGCLYCYAANNSVRFKQRARADWTREELTKNASITSYPAREGVIMFPSAHDITPFNLDAYVRVAKLILASGNRLLIVSKPRLECITRVVDELVNFKSQIMFRFTIGSMNPDVSGFWEPHASPPAERIEALKLAHDAGYRTSVSGEPLLGGLQTAIELVAAVRPFVTDTVWIGKMNKMRQRVDMSVPRNADEVVAIERMQADGEIVKLYEHFKVDPIIEWKDSIVDVLAKDNSYSVEIDRIKNGSNLV